jgi:hypothetical protein
LSEKPDNVMNVDGAWLKVLDLGLAKLCEDVPDAA